MPTKKYIPTHWRSIFMPWMAFLLAAVSLGTCIYLLGQYVPEQEGGESVFFLKTSNQGKVSTEESTSMRQELAEAGRLNEVMRLYLLNVAASPKSPAWPRDTAVLDGRVAVKYEIPPMPFRISFNDSVSEYWFDNKNLGVQHFDVSIGNVETHEGCRNMKIGEREFCLEEEWENAYPGQDSLEQRYFLKLENYQGPFELKFDFSSVGMESCTLDRESKDCLDDQKTFRKNVEKILESVKVDFLS